MRVPLPQLGCEKWDVGCEIIVGIWLHQIPSSILTSNFSTLTSQLVWASPRSLAATYGITIVFFSSGYLDVSVPRVASLHL
jgi:hypothetical protein